MLLGWVAAFLSDEFGGRTSALLEVVVTSRHPLPKITDVLYRAIEIGNHADDEATLDTYAEGLDMIREGLCQVEGRSPVLGAAMGLLRESSGSRRIWRTRPAAQSTPQVFL